MPLTDDDRLQIQEVYARYCQAVDRNDPQAWAGVFTEDAVFDGTVRLKGRSEISAFAEKRPARLQDEGWQRMQHWTSNLVIEETDYGAAGRCYFMILGLRSGESQPVLVRFGTYSDELVPTDGQWLIRRRTSD